MQAWLNDSLGLDVELHQLTNAQMLFRTLLMFFAMLIMMRLAGLRFLAGKTTFDVLLGFIMASMLSRAVNGTAPFFGTILAGFLVVILHRLLAYLTYKFHSFGRLVKGQAEPVVIDGEIQTDATARHRLSDNDLMEDLRLNAAVDDVKKVKMALIERNGEISVQCEPEKATVITENDGKTIHVHFHS